MKVVQWVPCLQQHHLGGEMGKNLVCLFVCLLGHSLVVLVHLLLVLLDSVKFLTVECQVIAQCI